MLQSNRFTTSITQSTQNRLNLVLNNRRPMTRRERHRGAVVAVQTGLADLNRDYMSAAEVDGYFGRKTAQAVESFQRDYGLVADGIVGRQTLTELDQMYASDLFRTPQGMSIHVGVNRVDPSHYGSDLPLTACVNDAHDFQTLAQDLGYDPVLLTDQDATTSNFVAAMRQAIENLFSGDALFVTFSGHGSQIENTSPDEETDLRDETLCFYDRMLIDDELYSLLSELRPGVQVSMLYDSCHSGTVTRMLPIEDQASTRDAQIEVLTRTLSPTVLDANPVAVANQAENRFIPIKSADLQKALDGDRPEQGQKSNLKGTSVQSIVEVLEQTIKEARDAKARVVGIESGIYERNVDLYMAVKNAVGSNEDRQLECNVVALSACQDNQTTLDGAVNGYFTGNVLQIWDRGGFSGSYREIHRRLRAQSRPDITPVINTYGGSRAQARLNDRPFAF